MVLRLSARVCSSLVGAPLARSCASFASPPSSVASGPPPSPERTLIFATVAGERAWLTTAHPPAKKLGRATGYMTVRKMLDEYEWNSVADIGSGAGGYSKLFHHLNKSVTSYELGRRYSSSNVSDFTSRELKPGHELAYRAAVTNDGGAPWRGGASICSESSGTCSTSG